MCATGDVNGSQQELRGVPVGGEEQDAGEHEVAPDDPAEPEPVLLECDVQEERRPEDVAGPDHDLGEARLNVPGEVRRDEVGEEQHPDREPRSGMPRQAAPTPAASASRVCPCADPLVP